jgi:hypothetical protein
MDLCYQIEFSEDIKEENVSYYDETKKAIIISDSDYINIIPKSGGIHRISIFFSQAKEDFVFASFDDMASNVIEIYNAQDASYMLEGFFLNIYGEDDDKYYSSAFFLIEDYVHNFYLNMLIFEINKNDFTDIEERVYDEVDLLYTYNEGEGYICWFDQEYMKKFLNLKNRMDKILK